MDGQPFVDGGIRFLGYMETLFAGIRHLDRASTDLDSPHYDVRLNLRVIVNGNQSPNDPGGIGALAAANCDKVSDPDHAAACAPVANTLLGSFLGGGAGKGLILRVTQDAMVHQLKVDSVYKLYHDWRDLGVPGSFKFTYVSNQELAHPPIDARLSGPCQPDPKKALHFDPDFPACLFAIGRAKGAIRQWSYSETADARETDATPERSSGPQP